MRNSIIIYIYNIAEYLNTLFILSPHIDNFKIYASTREVIDTAKEEIIILFLIKDFGFIAYYLELQVERDR
jgi:hypothetical protein